MQTNEAPKGEFKGVGRSGVFDDGWHIQRLPTPDPFEFPSKFSTVAERVAFLQQYVTFRRTYETLDFDIMYQSNGGGSVPGPSDWDIRVIATVPASELSAWVPPGVPAATAPNTDWLKSVPTAINFSGLNEWYSEGHRIIGLDRARRIVVYRASS